MGSKSDQTHSEEEILHQELLHTMILMQPPTEKTHKHLIALRTYWSKNTLYICSLCFLSFSYSVNSSCFFPISFLNELLVAIVIGYKLEQMDFWSSRIGSLLSVSMLLLCFSGIYVPSIVRIVSQIVLTHLNMLERKLGSYTITHCLWIFVDKLQEVSSVITIRHL